MANTTSATNDNQLSGYYVQKAVATLYNETPLYDVAMKTPLPQGYGTQVKWNSWRKVGGASSALTEGGANTAVALSSRLITATIAQYSRVITISDVAEYANVLDTREGAQNELRMAAKETWEQVCHTGIFKSTYYTQNQSKTVILSAMMSGVASSFSANTGTNTNSNKQFQFPAVFSTASAARLSAVSPTAPTASSLASMYGIRKAVNRLERFNVPAFADGYYFGYAHPNFIHILRRDQSWTDWNKYTNSKETMYAREIGRTWGVRWSMSNMCPRYAVTAHSVNITFICGQNAFGVTQALDGLQMYLVTGAQKSDPANTLSYLSFKLTGAAACLNPSAGVLLFSSEKL